MAIGSFESGEAITAQSWGDTPAYPGFGYLGVTKLDYFAIRALGPIIDAYMSAERAMPPPELTAALAYSYARAMVEQHDKEAGR